MPLEQYDASEARDPTVLFAYAKDSVSGLYVPTKSTGSAMHAVMHGISPGGVAIPQSDGLVYGSPTTIVLPAGLLSLATGSYVQSDFVDNTSLRYSDALVSGSIQVGTTPTVNTTITVLVYGSIDGTHFTGGASGISGAYSPTVNNQLLLRPLEVIQVSATSNVDYSYGPRSVAAALGLPVLPPYWGKIVLNSTAVALNATGTNNFSKYVGVK